jgi:hypothetical protein
MGQSVVIFERIVVFPLLVEKEPGRGGQIAQDLIDDAAGVAAAGGLQVFECVLQVLD